MCSELNCLVGRVIISEEDSVSSHAGGNCVRHTASPLVMPFKIGLSCGRRLPGMAGGLCPQPLLKSVGGPREVEVPSNVPKREFQNLPTSFY